MVRLDGPLAFRPWSPPKTSRARLFASICSCLPSRVWRCSSRRALKAHHPVPRTESDSEAELNCVIPFIAFMWWTSGKPKAPKERPSHLKEREVCDVAATKDAACLGPGAVLHDHAAKAPASEVPGRTDQVANLVEVLGWEALGHATSSCDGSAWPPTTAHGGWR